MKNVSVGSWALFVDDVSGENIMVKIIEKDDSKRIAKIEMDLAIRKNDSANKYVLEVSYDDLKQPKLKLKNKKRAV